MQYRLGFNGVTCCQFQGPMPAACFCISAHAQKRQGIFLTNYDLFLRRVMQFDKTKYFKALFLLLVFSMNSVMSFACSFSNLFHSFHHHKVEAPIEHQHAGNHHHNKSEGHKHEHNNVAEHHHDNDSQKPGDDDCCSNKVIQIEKVEKAISRTIAAPEAISHTSLFVYCTQLNVLPQPDADLLQHAIRWRHPTTIPDLRIVIQSFQI